MAEHMSCTNPGSVISPDRVPPPIWSHASSNKTCFPACARVIPADSPFGPEPTITASYDMRCLRKKLSANGRGGDRTLTGVTPHGILSPVRLPIPPLGLNRKNAGETAFSALFARISGCQIVATLVAVEISHPPPSPVRRRGASVRALAQTLATSRCDRLDVRELAWQYSSVLPRA